MAPSMRPDSFSRYDVLHCSITFNLFDQQTVYFCGDLLRPRYGPRRDPMEVLLHHKPGGLLGRLFCISALRLI